MIDAKRLLADLKRLRRQTEDDLRQHHRASPGRAAVEAEWREAFDAKRTADTFETFWSAALDQAAVHWLLALVFLRFLEDNSLLDRPLLSGPGERLELAELRQREFFRARPHDSDAEYLLAIFDAAAKLPGLAGLYDKAHNPLFRLPVSGDGAMALLEFFRARAPDTGQLVHDFTDPAWTTRFLGDLYQDLSDEAKKRYALLQTPEFVEAWILSRTLDPAIREFGYAQVRMIDPTCGSGHFLLGGFARVLAEWQRAAPDMPPAAQAQKALDAVAGVDLNPFAAEIARFRLLLAALRAAGETRLAASPDFRIALAIGDSLFHGTHFSHGDLGGVAEGFGRRMQHHYVAEDTGSLDAILGRQYHAVVGNPPYITPKDAAMREAYREIYSSCHMKYGLGVPFTERFFDLALDGRRGQAAGFVGLIVANSFMKREFGKKLIEDVLPKLDLTHVVDCSGAYIPGHGTPTVILYGRNRAPVAGVVRTVRGIRGEPSAPDDPAHANVWSAIVEQSDIEGSTSEFVSTEDTPRTELASHPWNMGGGGAADVQILIEQGRETLGGAIFQIGFSAVTGADEVFVFGTPHDLERTLRNKGRCFVVGEDIRDYCISSPLASVWLYDSKFQPLPLIYGTAEYRHLWPHRVVLSARKLYGQPILQSGLHWYEYGEVNPVKQKIPLSITFGFVVTHNHFAFSRGGKVFGRSAPVIKLPNNASENDHLSLLGLLNSSTGCFWIKQVCHNKGGQGINEGAKAEAWERFLEVTGTRLESFPLAANPPLDLASALDAFANSYASYLPIAVCAAAVPTRACLDAARDSAAATRAAMIALQEELDWRCYRLYALHDDPPEHPDPPGLRLGERAFEIVMARRMAAGALETAWFTRHGSTPITDLPANWPADYRATVERRIALIESDPTIGLIERPEYKRRWSAPTWEEMEQDALRSWLLDRLEDARHWPRDDPRILSTNALADSARRDGDFLSVAALYVGRDAFDLEALVADLVSRESVPFLARLRYSETGQRKRADWEATWEKQRAEDAIDAEVYRQQKLILEESWAHSNPRRDDESAEVYAARMTAGLTEPRWAALLDHAVDKHAKERKAAEIGPIAVPPKYKTADFLSQDFWRLRGGLDVPKERFVAFPHAARDADPALPVLWAGHDHLSRTRALAAWYVDRKDIDGWTAPRLAPLLAGLLELVPWLLQWHNDIDAGTGLRMGAYFAEFVEEEARSLGLTLADLRAWTPPAPLRRTRARRASA